jgi:hypothetical protein
MMERYIGVRLGCNISEAHWINYLKSNSTYPGSVPVNHLPRQYVESILFFIFSYFPPKHRLFLLSSELANVNPRISPLIPTLVLSCIFHINSSYYKSPSAILQHRFSFFNCVGQQKFPISLFTPANVTQQLSFIHK